MTTGLVSCGSAVSTLIVCTPAAGMLKAMTAGLAMVAAASAFTAAIAARSDPGPESAVVVTTWVAAANTLGGAVTKTEVKVSAAVAA